jgi:hypothetical protein
MMQGGRDKGNGNVLARLHYFVLPDFIESSQLGLVSVLPEECV